MLPRSSLLTLALLTALVACNERDSAVESTRLGAGIEYVNPRFSVLTGYTLDESLGENPRILKSDLTPEDTYAELWRTLKEGRAWRGLFVNKKKTGELYWEDAWISPIFSSDGHITHYVAVKEDITQRIEAEHRVAQSHRDLELYASFLQHDIRNDLQVVMNHIEAAKLLVNGVNPVTQYLDTAEAASERIVHLLDIFGRPGAADDRDLLKILKKVKEQAMKAHTNLSVKIRSDTEDTELQSARLLPIVFDNLLRNSAEYSEGHVAVSISVSREGGNIQAVLSDDGPGIDKEIIDNLFQKGTSTTGGGFGLYLSKKVIEGYGGSIELIQQEKGTAYRILLPAI